MMKSIPLLTAFVLTVGFSLPVLADNFDGSKPLICATVEARDCVLGAECFTGHAKKVGAPAFFRIDFDKKVVAGTQRTSPIVSIEKNEQQILLQGSEMEYGWTIALDQTEGDFTASMTNRDGAFLLFGSCTLLP